MRIRGEKFALCDFKFRDFVLHFPNRRFEKNAESSSVEDRENRWISSRMTTAFVLVAVAVFLPFLTNAGRYLPAEPLELRLIGGILLTQGSLFLAAVLPFLFPPESWSRVPEQLGLRRMTGAQFLRMLKLSLPVFVGITLCSSLLTMLGKWFGESNPTQPLVELLIKAPFPVFLIIFCSAVLIAPVVEELAFRRVLYSGLRQWAPPMVCAVVVSLLFALVHAVIWQVPALFLLALVFQREYLRSGENTSCTIALHSMYNFLTIFCAFCLRLYYLNTGRIPEW